jgi:ankyrin repeat protein
MTLHYAAWTGNEEYIKNAISEGQDLARFSNKFNALHLAILAQHSDIVTHILNADHTLALSVTTNSVQLPYAPVVEKHWSPFKMAASLGDAVTLFELFQKIEGWGGIDTASILSNSHICNLDGVVNVLMGTGADSNILSRQTCYTACRGQLSFRDVVNSIGDGVCQVYFNPDNCTLMHRAVEFRAIHMIQRFVDLGCDVNASDIHGNTALHWAVRPCDYPGKKKKFGKFMYSMGIGVSLGKDEKFDRRAVYSYAIPKLGAVTRKALVRELIRAGADVNRQNHAGETAMSIVASMGDFSCMVALREANGDPSIGDNEGSTPIHEAAKGGDVAVLTKLKELGADVFARDNQARTALHVAASTAIIWLHECGLSVSDRDGKGWTALHYATASGQAESVKILLQLGADVSALTDDGLTPAVLAKKISSLDRKLVESALSVPKPGWWKSVKRSLKFEGDRQAKPNLGTRMENDSHSQSPMSH